MIKFYMQSVPHLIAQVLTWLQSILGTEYEVIVYDRLNPIHNLDYSIVPIGRDILLLNVDRLSGENLPTF
jgi:hypothetical protein